MEKLTRLIQNKYYLILYPLLIAVDAIWVGISYRNLFASSHELSRFPFLFLVVGWALFALLQVININAINALIRFMESASYIGGVLLITWLGFYDTNFKFGAAFIHLVRDLFSREYFLLVIIHLVLVIVFLFRTIQLTHQSVFEINLTRRTFISISMLGLNSLFFPTVSIFSQVLLIFGFLLGGILMIIHNLILSGQRLNNRLPQLDLPVFSNILKRFGAVLAGASVFSFIVIQLPKSLMETFSRFLLNILSFIFAITLGPIISLIGQLFGNLDLSEVEDFQFGSFIQDAANAAPEDVPLEEATEIVQPTILNLTLSEPMKWAIFIGMVLIIVLIIVFSQRNRSRSKQILLTRENSEEVDANLIGAAPRRRSDRRSRKKIKDMLSEVRIRWIYWQIEEYAKRLGEERPKALTPLEYLPRLQACFPEASQELTFLTQQYMITRYGETDTLTENRDRIETAWEEASKIAKHRIRQSKSQFRRNR